MTFQLSICVLTYKRPDALLRLLRSIEEQDIDKAQIKLEVVIIDTDQATAPDPIIQQFIGDTAVKIQYDTSPKRRNISEGRNTAAQKAKHDHILWLDDDQSIPENFLLDVEKHWSLYIEKCMGMKFGVKYRAENGSTEFDKLFEPWMQLPEEGQTLSPHGVATGALLVKKALFSTHTFDSFWGHMGGEDNALFLEAYSSGATIISCPSLTCTEWVTQDRLKLSYFFRCHYRQGLTYALLMTRNKNISYRMRYAAQALVYLLISCCLACFAPLKGRTHLKLALFKVTRQIGKLSALVGLRYSIYQKN